MNHFDSLPNELIVKIFRHFDFTQLKMPDLQLVCKRFYSLSRDPSLQKELRIPSHLNFMQVLLVLKQRPSIKTLTIVETSRRNKDKRMEVNLYEAPFDVILPFGCIYIKIQARGLDGQIDILTCERFKTFGTFEPNNKNILSNLQELRIYERIEDFDLINIANCCRRLENFYVRGSFSQNAMDSLTQCKKLTQLTLVTNCGKFDLNHLSKEKLPFLKSLILFDEEAEGGEEEREFRNLENWFHDQKFSHLTELDLEIIYDGPHNLLFDICNNCPNLVNLGLRGELVGGSDNLRLIRRFQHLETFEFRSPDLIWSDLDSNNLRKMLCLFEVAVTKMKWVELMIHMNEIPLEDIQLLKRTAKEHGIDLRFVDYLEWYE